MKEYEFVIEVLKDDGSIVKGGEFKSDQRLFNERDLNELTKDLDKKRVLVRLKYDTRAAYVFHKLCECWVYEPIESAINTIKRQI